MFDNPVEQRLFKTDVVPGLLALNPFVPEDFFALGEEFLVEQRFADEFGGFVSRSAQWVGMIS